MRTQSLFVLAGCLSLTTPAAATNRTVSGGIGSIVNDPFLKQKIVSVGLQYHPQARPNTRPTVVFGADALYSPDFGSNDFRPLTTKLIENISVSPDISTISYALRGNIVVYPGSYSAGSVETKVGIGTSIGAVKTTDSLEALDVDRSSEIATATMNQIHPCSGLLIVGEIWRQTTGLRLRWDTILFIETVNSTTLEMKNNGSLMLDLMVRL